MGNLFYRGQPINVIQNMRFAELREWNYWHDLMANEESKIICSKCKKKYDSRKNKKCPYCGGE
jgi:rRNA maturation endonuclease Nob1